LNNIRLLELFINFNQVENARRKHNYIPLILELLKMTAKKGKLDSLVEEAR
jgi:ubiquitin carboxyl-terminal hydrolase L5